ARVALPPVLVRVVEPLHHRGQHPRLLRRAHVPDLVGQVAESAEEIRPVRIALGEALALADAHHGRSARLRLSGRAGNVVEIAGRARMGDVYDGGAVELHLAGERVEAPAAVMPDIGDPAIPLLLDYRVVRGGMQEIGLTVQN